MSYEIIYDADALDDLKRLPANIRPQIRRVLQSLSNTPRPDSSIQLRPPQDRYRRVWVGKWRVIYEIDDEEQVVYIQRIKLKTGPETYEEL